MHGIFEIFFGGDARDHVDVSDFLAETSQRAHVNALSVVIKRRQSYLLFETYPCSFPLRVVLLKFH